MNANTHSLEPNPQYDDEIDLFELVHSLWRQKGLIAGCVIATVFSVGAFHLSALSIPTPAVLETEILFTFPGAEKGNYPDGTPFLTKDLTSNEVLLRTIQSTGIAVDPTKVAQSLFITPGSSLIQSAEDDLRGIRQNTKTPAEILTEVENRLADTRSLANKSARLRLDLDHAELSGENGSRFISHLLENWAERSERDYGVSTAKVSLPLQAFDWDRGVDIAVNIDALSQQLSTITTSIAGMRRLPGIETTTDGTRTIVDLETRAQLLRDRVDPLRSFLYHYYAVLAQDSTTIRIQRDSRIRTLELAIQEKTRLIDSYTSALSSLAGLNVRSMEQSQASLQDGPGVDGSFLNEMLKLGEQLGDQEMKQELQRKRLGLIEEISGLRQQLELIRGVEDLQLTTAEVEQYIEEQFPVAIAGVNQLRDDAEALLKVVSERSLNSRQNLYQILKPAELADNGYQPQKVSLQLALAVVLGGMLGCLVALIRSAAFKRRAPAENQRATTN